MFKNTQSIIKSRIIVIIIIILFALGCGYLAISVLRNIFLPDIVIITIDALRPDHLGCYGYERETSPNIDRLAKEGVCFLNAFSPGSSTTAAMPSFLSGKYLNIYNKEAVFNTGLKNILDKKFTLLAEYLKQWGYYSEAFITNWHLNAGSGFEQGFSRYNFYSNTTDAKDLTSSVLRFLSGYHSRKPYFIWIHYLDTHIPFRHTGQYTDNLEHDKSSGKIDKMLRVQQGKVLDKYRSRYDSQGYIPAAGYIEGKHSLNYYIGRYDGEIRYIDGQLARLLKCLKKNTLIIISADHGESLGEHNIYIAHGENIYDEVLRVPLIIKDAGLFKGGLKINPAVSSVDIVPTILSRVNPPWYFFNKNKFDGVDLNSVMLKKEAKRRYIYSFFPWASSIRDVRRNFKYILNEGDREELYSLPDENNNLIAAGSWKTDLIKSELKANLMDWLRYHPVRCDINVERMPLSDEEGDNLKSLGYVQ